MPIDRNTVYLFDILKAARMIQEFVRDIDRTAFENDALRQDAVKFRIIVIGEATKRLSNEFRQQHPEIRWSDMAGMRDFLAHDYDKVIVSRVWETATVSIPELIAQLDPLLPPDTDSP